MDSSLPLVTPLSQLAPRQLSWLWPGRLARGKISMFDGDPEIGKSLVTLDLCARITAGRNLPDSGPAVEPANVIILNGEDDVADTIVPRLRVLGADLDRVFIFSSETLEKTGPFRLPAANQVLDNALAQTRAVFTVLDPIMAFLDSSIQVASDMSVRRALSPLAALAERHGCHITMVRHLNKTRHFRSLYRGGGSIGFLAACRSAFLFARDPDDPQRAVMAQIKNNLAPRQPSLAYRLQAAVHVVASSAGVVPSPPEPAPVAPHSPDHATIPVIEWLGPSPLTADELLAAGGMKPYLSRPCDRAKEFLLNFLDAGPRSTIDIWQAGEQEGHAKRTLQRVSALMSIRSKTAMVNNRQLTFWLLKDQKLPPDVDPKDPDIPSLEPWLAPLREQYPDDPLDGDF
jgi:AAA domain